MRAPLSDLPVRLEHASVLVRGLPIVDGVSLEWRAGPPTALIGPNGSGKTTLLRLAMGLTEASSGRVTWGGRERAPPTRRGFLFQRPVMLRRSAAANLRYALAAAGFPARERAARADALLAQVGLTAIAERPARRLSGGEQQRLAVARALAKEPELLFLDEPTASLDPAATKAMEDLIVAIAARGIKIVMSTHNLPQARRLAGEIVLLNRGRVVESGPTQDFFAAPRTDEARRFLAGELLI
ncbi:MAG: ABC transporter ATP-binding protein [Pseudorhodoplanes sp.]